MVAMSGTPLVSFVMSVRDGERYLAAAIDSVLEQTLTDFELVVIDDGSTDSSPQILDEYASSDERVLVHRQENSGLTRSLNRGFARARAALIARLDADDVARPDRLERQVGYLARNPEVGLVGGAVVFIDGDGRPFAEAQYPTSDAEIRAAFSFTTPFVHSAATMRREVWDAAGGYRTAFPYAEDLDLWVRIGAVSQLANLDETVVSYRIHPQQITLAQLERQSLSVLGARIVSRALAQGRPDPFAETALVDGQELLRAGASVEDMTTEFVQLAVWLAKTLSRAGQPEAAARLFGEAEARARSDSGSRALVSSVEVARERVRSR
jgi:hypothetical protein